MATKAEPKQDKKKPVDKKMDDKKKKVVKNS